MTDILDDTLGPVTRVAHASVSVDHDRVVHGLTLHAYGVGADGKRIRVEIEVPADQVPSLMISIIINGGGVLADVADAWRRGDCSTCGNLRMIDEPRRGNRTERVHCPDCNRPGDALAGFPVLRRPGEPSIAP